MNRKEIEDGVKRGLIQYDLSCKSSIIVGIEMIIVAFCVGMYFESFGAAIIAFIALPFLHFIPYVGFVVVLLFSFMWGALGYTLLQEWGASLFTTWVVAIVVFLIAFGAHAIYKK